MKTNTTKQLKLNSKEDIVCGLLLFITVFIQACVSASNLFNKDFSYIALLTTQILVGMLYFIIYSTDLPDSQKTFAINLLLCSNINFLCAAYFLTSTWRYVFLCGFLVSGFALAWYMYTRSTATDNATQVTQATLETGTSQHYFLGRLVHGKMSTANDGSFSISLAISDTAFKNILQESLTPVRESLAEKTKLAGLSVEFKDDSNLSSFLEIKKGYPVLTITSPQEATATIAYSYTSKQDLEDNIQDIKELMNNFHEVMTILEKTLEELEI